MITPVLGGDVNRFFAEAYSFKSVRACSNQISKIVKKGMEKGIEEDSALKGETGMLKSVRL